MSGMFVHDSMWFCGISCKANPVHRQGPLKNKGAVRLLSGFSGFKGLYCSVAGCSIEMTFVFFESVINLDARGNGCARCAVGSVCLGLSAKSRWLVLEAVIVNSVPWRVTICFTRVFFARVMSCVKTWHDWLQQHIGDNTNLALSTPL